MSRYPNTDEFLANMHRFVFDDRPTGSHQDPIRKIRVSLAGPRTNRRRRKQESPVDLPLTTYGIFLEFSRFGEIVDIWRKPDCAIILYATLATDIDLSRRQDIALTSATYTIESINEEDYGHYIKVNRSEQCSIDAALSVPPDQDSPKQIVNVLPDDMLMAIFEGAHLLDLCEIANTCRRFNAVAVRLFSARYANRVCPFDDLRYGDGEVTLTQMDRCVRTFAGCTVPFKDHIKNCRNIDIYLGMLHRHRATVIDLDLSNETVRPDTLDAIRPMLMRLRWLSLSVGDMHPVRIDANDSWRLRRLSIDWHNGAQVPPVVAVAGLAELDLNRVNDDSETWLSNVLPGTPDVRVLRLLDARVSMRHLQAMADHLANLNELHMDRIYWYGFGDSRLNERNSSFRSLRRLVIRNASSSDKILPVLDFSVFQNVPIEEVTLHWFMWRESRIFALICQMQSIRKLAIRGPCGGAAMACGHYLRIVREMKQLRELTVDSTEIGFEHVEQVLQDGNQLTMVHVRLTMLRFDGNVEVLDAIAALITATPGRRVTVRAHVIDIDVSVD